MDLGSILARSLDGTHYSRPEGAMNVSKDDAAWLTDTVRMPRPHEATSIDIGCGRCHPDHTFGIEDPYDNIQQTGETVLALWNARLSFTMCHYPKPHAMALAMNPDLTDFLLFDKPLERINIADYEWKENKRHNLEGFHRLTKQKCFIW